MLCYYMVMLYTDSPVFCVSEEEGVLQEMLDWNVCPVVGCFWSNAVLIELYTEVLGIWMHNPPHLCASSPTCFKC